MVSDHILIPCALALTHILHRVSPLGHNNVRKVEHTEQRAQTSAVQDDETSTPDLPTYGTRYWQVQDNLFHVEYMTLFTKGTLEDPTYAWTEESELRSDESGDLVIFRDVDSIFLDDRILGMMREAFQRRPPSGEDVLKFVVEVLERRSGLSLGNAEGKATTPVQWPWALSTNARITLVELLGDSIRTQVFKTSVEDWWLESPYSDPGGYWMNRTLSLIFSLCAGDGDLPQSLSSTLEEQLRDEEQAESCCCVLAYQLEKYLNGLTPAVSLNWQARVFALLLPTLRTLPIEEAAGIFIGIVERAYGGIYNLIETHYPKQADKSIAETNPQGDSEFGSAGGRNQVLSPQIVLLLTDVAAGILHLLVPDGEAPKAEGDHIMAFPMNTESLLDFIFKTIPVIQRVLPDVNLIDPLPICGGDVDVLFWRLLMRPRHTHSFLAFWSIRSVALQAQLRMDGFLYNTLRSGWAVLRDQEAVEFLLACAGYFDEMTKAEATPALLSVIQICRLVVSVQTSEHTDVLRAWHGMFRSATTLINQFSLAHVDWCNAQGHGQTCAAVYALLDEIDDLDLRRQLSPSRDFNMPGLNSIDNVLSTEDQAYKSWSRESNVEEDPVPDAFINALLQRVVCDMHTWNRMGRGRRLQEQLDRRAGLAGRTTAVPARAEQTGNQPWLSQNLLACMARPYLLSPSSDIPFSAPPHSPLSPIDSTFSLCDTVESFQANMASVDVAPADNFPSHSPSLGDAADKGAQSPAIGPVTEELAASSAVSVDLPVASG